MNPAQSPVNKHIKTGSPFNRNRKTHNGRPKLKRPLIRKIDGEKGQCCVEANKKIKQLEKINRRPQTGNKTPAS